MNEEDHVAPAARLRAGCAAAQHFRRVLHVVEARNLETGQELGFRNVHAREGDGYFGWKEEAPFDGIMITAAV